MQTRRLGRTEHHSSVAVLGGATFMDCTAVQADAAVRTAVARGVNHIDIAPTRNDRRRPRRRSHGDEDIAATEPLPQGVGSR